MEQPYHGPEDRRGITAHDLTSSQEVSAARQFAEMIVDTVREGLLVLDLGLRVVAANESFYRMFGVAPEETEGRLVYELGNGEWDVPELRDLLEDILPARKVFDGFEVAREFENVGRRVMLLNARQLDDHQMILLAIEDVTEHYRTERTRRKAEERFRALVSATSYAVYRMNSDWSELRILDGRGLIADAERPSSVWLDEYVHPEDQPKVLAAIREAVGTKRPFEEEHRMQRADGSVGWTLSRAVPLLDEHGEIAEWVGAASDVTARKQAEEALRESEERFRIVAELVPDLLWRSEPDGSTTWFNARWAEYTGRTPEESAGWGWLAALHPEDRTRVRREYERALEAGYAVRMEHRIRGRDGSYRWFLVRTRPVRDEDGRVQHWLGAATDVHEQKTALETLEERVEERTRQVRDLARRLTMAEQEERRRISQILHDELQQLLYGLGMKVELLHQDLQKDPRSDLEGDLEEMRRWIDQAVDMTRQLTVELSPPVLNSEGLASTIEWLQRPMAELHGLEVALDVDGPVVLADEDLRVLLFQIVRELLFNVVKHAETDRAAVELRETADHVRITVTDEGKGFDVETAEAESVGGFGLSSARERLGLVGGQMDVDAAPGKGTRVTIHVPLHLGRASG